jgi:hypothetical protein
MALLAKTFVGDGWVISGRWAGDKTDDDLAWRLVAFGGVMVTCSSAFKSRRSNDCKLDEKVDEKEKK